jgi:hypothetical protein
MMQLAYDLSAGETDKTYPLDLVRDVLALWDQRDEKYHNRDLKPICWDEIREKLNFTAKYWEGNIIVTAVVTSSKGYACDVHITCSEQIEKKNSISITNLMHLFIKSYQHSHLKLHMLKMSMIHNYN